MRGVIAAGNPDTAGAGASILAQGGNAVDAAVAAAFVSFIAEIGLVHPAGGGIAHIFDPETSSARVYDFFCNTPGLGGGPSPDELDFHEVFINFGPTRQSFHVGRGSVAVPGNLVGLVELAAERGSLPLEVLLAPTIRLAESGVALDRFQAETCQLLEAIYTHTPEMRDLFEPGGQMLGEGEKLLLPELAETLRELAANGTEYLRHGRFARALVDDQQKNGGLVTQRDLDHYRVEQSDPILVNYRDHQVLMPPPCSTGGVLTAFSLLVLSAFEPPGAPSSSSLRLLAEVMAATSRARTHWDRWLETVSPVEAVLRFLAPPFVRQWVAEVENGLRGRRAPLVPEAEGPSSTTHLSVVDAHGMAVSLTTSAGESAGFLIPGTGVIANNIMGEDDLHPAGFHTRPPGQRIPTMMTPTLVLRDGRIRCVVGTGGSTRIRSAILQVLTNLIDHRMPLRRAVEGPRIHLEADVVQCEKEIPGSFVRDLADWGWKVNHWPKKSIYFGGAHSVGMSPAGELVGVGDPRRAGVVAEA